MEETHRLVLYPNTDKARKPKKMYLLWFKQAEAVKRKDFLTLFVNEEFANNYELLKKEEFDEWLPLTAIPDFVLEIYKNFIHLDYMDNHLKDFLETPYYQHPDYLLF